MYGLFAIVAVIGVSGYLIKSLSNRGLKVVHGSFSITYKNFVLEPCDNIVFRYGLVTLLDTDTGNSISADIQLEDYILCGNEGEMLSSDFALVKRMSKYELVKVDRLLKESSVEEQVEEIIKERNSYLVKEMITLAVTLVLCISIFSIISLTF